MPFSIGLDLRKLMIAGVVSFLITMVLVATTWWYAPSLLWLAGLCSIAIGYLTYEFGEVLKAVPTALNAASAATGARLGVARTTIKHWTSVVIGYFSKKHPFTYFGGAIATPLAFLLVAMIQVKASTPTEYALGFAFFWIVLAFIFSCVIMVVFAGLAVLGQMPTHDEQVSFDHGEYGYGRFLLWVALGLCTLVLWHMWEWLAIAAKVFFKLVHSNKRLMVAVDGPMCGFLTAGLYYYYGPQTTTLFDCVIVLVCGSVLTMAVIAANYELVAKRWYGFFAKPA